MTESRLVTADEVAERFGVSVGTVNQWVRQRRIPCIRPTRKTVRFRLDDVERAITTPKADEGAVP